MPISWNEIRQNAIKFSREWAGVKSESAEAQTFWNEFFQVFGIKRRLVASFEEAVKKISGDYGYIDLFWPTVLLVEHKSLGQDLRKAETQAFQYIRDLANKPELRDDIPRYIIVSDFARIALHDLEPEEQRDLPLFDKKRGVTHEFPLAEFHRHVQHFAFIPGYKQHRLQEEDPVNIEAVEIMGELHDALEAGGYTGHDLERFLVRILFCLFAEDTGIFERESFHLFIDNRTAPDGSDLGQCLARLFEVLNTPPEKRQKNLDETLAAFPYVNGDLFNEHLGFADFNRDMRSALLACTRKDWSRISPAIFGSLFQSIMEPKERRQIGGHYTSEPNILKVVRSLFLDELRTEFDSIKADRSTRRRARLDEFHAKLCRFRFFDPACGCGNFLVITYRELRQLELEVLKEIFGKQTEFTLAEINKLSQVDVDQFYGIEIGEWPARIAEVALWLMDQQMNLKVSEAFGQLYQRLPLKKSPTIVCGNALRLDWKQILPPEKCSYVLGNPPFVGKHLMTGEQGQDMELVWGETDGTGVLDYVTAWYRKAAEYIQGTRIVVGFVSTSSISQGEQVGVLWNPLFQRFGLKIHFGHRTFAWISEARGMAHVHVVIIGFGAFDTANKRIYDYEGEKPTVVTAKNISPYLIEGADFAVTSRSKPICDVPACEYGSKPTDGGHLIVEEEERRQFLAENPNAKKYLRTLLCAEEYLYSIPRWCLWLVDASPADIRNIPGIKKRVDAVREFRLASKKVSTQKMAEMPSVFAEIRQPQSRFMVIPQHTSETRKYVPFGYFDAKHIVHNSCSAIPDATFFHFGVLTSAIHMAWVRQICGRLESRYRYSTRLVYNNFPWPDATAEQRERVEAKARAVLAARGPHLPPRGLGTLADLYDPLTMPPDLLRAHAELDRAAEKCYRAERFHSDRERVEFLFSLYEKLTAPLLPVSPRTRGRRSQTVGATVRRTRQRTPALPGQNPPS
jgi:restriction-modification enzyme MmeI-like protein